MREYNADAKVWGTATAVLGASMMLLPWIRSLPRHTYSIWTTQVASTTATSGEAKVLISGVLYDGYQNRDADEAVELTNASDVTATLSGWKLCDWEGCRLLPDAVIAPGKRIWLARDATAFATSFGFDPDYELTSWPILNNADGDVVLLRGPDDSVVDTLVYKGDAAALPGWSGGALAPYPGLMGEAGQILSRITDESNGLPVADSDTAFDWIQSLADPAIGRRVRYPGWDLDPLFFPLRATEEATVVIGIAPDNAYDVVAATVQRARRAISIEVYSLRHPAIIEMLAEKARSGVRVTVLLEGDPVGVGVYSPEWQTQLYGCRELEAAGGACWFMIHDPSARRYQRYLYLHAKMLLVDDTWVVIGTQNLTIGGLPADDKSNGSLGSRGVVLATDAAAVVRQATRVFALDLDPTHHQDLLRWNTGPDAKYGLPDDALVDLEEPDGISYTVTFSQPLAIRGAFEFEVLSAPEAALRRSDGLLGLLDRAGEGDTVLVEQLYETLIWGDTPGANTNPRLLAYIAAARRGACVRILVNGRSFVDGLGVAEEGALTVAYLKSVARSEHLDLDAALGNPAGDGVHNKMILVDLRTAGQYTHIGSINGSEASNKVNREVAVQIRSAEAFDYLRKMFYVDWWQANPVFLPMLMRAYVPPRPPAAYVVVSEVAYAESAEAEWIELHNPTSYPVDLSHYKLGDAETRTSYEPMFGFPPNTSIEAGKTLVIAINGDQVPEADLEFYESAATVPNMAIYPGWGTSAYPLALRNSGDQVLLLGPDDRPVDVVVWGDATFPGIIPHPGVATIGASLERYPSGVDTGNCAGDFRERYPPTPGQLPPVNPVVY